MRSRHDSQYFHPTQLTRSFVVLPGGNTLQLYSVLPPPKIVCPVLKKHWSIGLPAKGITFERLICLIKASWNSWKSASEFVTLRAPWASTKKVPFASKARIPTTHDKHHSSIQHNHHHTIKSRIRDYLRELNLVTSKMISVTGIIICARV